MKISLGLLLGAAVAGIVVHYLNTPEGKAFVDRVKKDAEDLGGNLNGTVDDLVSKGKSIFGNAKEQFSSAREQFSTTP
ncbi:MAG: YtxH domain-containing protein [Chitinophagaceae bacterium]|nr:YtxH domain-containing protein [Chitinophagaceae bacterium]